MPRKPPKVRMMKPRLQAMDHRTCPPRPRTYANRVAEDPILAFYNSTEWRNLRAAIIRERGPTCQKCGTHADRPYCDHIEEIRDGGERLNPVGIEVLCASCHGLKTAQARARRFGLV